MAWNLGIEPAILQGLRRCASTSDPAKLPGRQVTSARWYRVNCLEGAVAIAGDALWPRGAGTTYPVAGHT